MYKKNRQIIAEFFFAFSKIQRYEKRSQVPNFGNDICVILPLKKHTVI